MDPISCVALASGAFKTLKAAISTGKDIQEMGNTIATWGQAFSDFNRLEERQKNPPWWEKTFKGSDEEAAILIWNQKRKMEQMRKEMKDHISFIYGPSAWDEVLRIEAEQRRIRKEAAYRKQEFIDNLINWTVGIVAFLIGGAILAAAIWIVGKARGRW
jgi:hypothetical protein